MKFTITILFIMLSWAYLKQNDMGIFDKLFGKKKENKPVIQNPPPSPPQGTKELMDENQFWDLISVSKANSKGNYDKQQVELSKELLKLDAENILEFDNRFRKYRGGANKWELWAAAYINIMNGGCSDDCFSDFRAWLIGHGKETYAEALANPESLTALDYNMENDEWEGLSFVSMTAYEKKTGLQLPNGFQENFDITGEEWEEDDLENRFPKLWSKWGVD